MLAVKMVISTLKILHAKWLVSKTSYLNLSMFERVPSVTAVTQRFSLVNIIVQNSYLGKEKGGSSHPSRRVGFRRQRFL